MNNHNNTTQPFTKRKFLFVSYDALISDVAWQVIKEGHEAKYYIKHEEDKDIADGFVPKVDNWEAEVDWADIVVFDDVLGMGRWAEKLRKQGKLVVGGSTYTDKLEDDRSFGQEELKKFGIPIIAYRNFTSFDDGIDFVRENPGRYVVKPSGESQNVKLYLFVGQDEDGKDIIQVLEAYKRIVGKKIREFQLQKYVTGVEVGVGGFFNGNEFVYPININFEHKKLFPGNIGPSTGEMGTSMFWSNANRLYNATLKKMEAKLAEEKYVGYFDLNCIVNSHGIYPLEFTSRFGYPTIHIQQEGILMTIADFLYGLADGSLKKFKARNGFQVGIRLVVPPFPYGGGEVSQEASSKDTVILFKKPNLEGIRIEETKLINGEWVVAGTYGVVLVVVGCGPTMKQAQRQAYTRMKNIAIPNMYYRTDIGDRWFEDSDKLHNWGYLREL
ncbi:phosphoribosylamine--glycine ligase [Patescibacteria group bacterium]|nr:phosphoribosylamine--glycine ligase [Patescibacteria group bacterium]